MSCSNPWRNGERRFSKSKMHHLASLIESFLDQLVDFKRGRQARLACERCKHRLIVVQAHYRDRYAVAVAQKM